MNDGLNFVEGPPREVVDAASVSAVFGVDCEVIPDPVSGAPLVVPRGRHHAGADQGVTGPSAVSSRG
jgi:iron complex transport system ATP-binding protein